MYTIVEIPKNDSYVNESYILVTPARDEEKNLPNLIISIERQTIKPVLWAIADDGSADSTPNIIKKLINKYDWVRSVRLKPSKEIHGTRYGVVCAEGFEYAERYCERHRIHYNYVALIDSDEIVEPRYFEKIFEKFATNPKLGIASGWVGEGDVYLMLEEIRAKGGTGDQEKLWALFGTEKIPLEITRNDYPNGSGRVWRRECYMVSKYGRVMGPDTISTIKAKLRGWETWRFLDIHIIGRKSATGLGPWKYYQIKGAAGYYWYYPKRIILINGTFFLTKPPHYIGISYFLGYLKAVVGKTERIQDKEMIQYFKTQKWHQFKKRISQGPATRPKLTKHNKE